PAAALRAQAERLRHHLAGRPGESLLDVARTLATARTHFDRRAAIVAPDRAALDEALRRFALDEPAANVVRGDPSSGGVAFLFTGQGSQLPRMGRALASRFPVFSDALDEIAAAIDRGRAVPLRALLEAAPGTPEAALLDETEHAQPALFAIEVALFRLYASWGVRPDALAGHSVGEIAAAHVAGVLSLAD